MGHILSQLDTTCSMAHLRCIEMKIAVPLYERPPNKELLGIKHLAFVKKLSDNSCDKCVSLCNSQVS